MVHRVEIALFLLFALLLTIALMTHFHGAASAAVKPGNERVKVSLEDARLDEINASALLNTYTVHRAALKGGTWYFEGLDLRNPQIRYLRAERARREAKLLEMEGNVSMAKLDGSLYRADKVRYDLGKRIVRSIGPFRAEKGESYVTGLDFRYGLDDKITRAKKVFAHYRMATKGKPGSGGSL